MVSGSGLTSWDQRRDGDCGVSRVQSKFFFRNGPDVQIQCSCLTVRFWVLFQGDSGQPGRPGFKGIKVSQNPAEGSGLLVLLGSAVFLCFQGVQGSQGLPGLIGQKGLQVSLGLVSLVVVLVSAHVGHLTGDSVRRA